MSDNITVAIKVRPLIKRERDQKLTEQWRIQNETIECVNAILNAKFSFDHICDEKTSTQTLYDKVGKKIVESAVNGFNGTIFAYGQTSSGKTHTMLGDSNEPGITVLSIRQIFENIKASVDRDFLLRVSYIEIYNERVYDLLKKRNELKIHENTSGDTNVNCIEKLVNSEQSILALITEGNKERKVAETNMNTQSSRSHTILTIIIESQDRKDESAQISVLNLVDLAGSERADATGATGSRLKEGSHINKSLLTLSMVINKLSDDPDQHINYRDSKLTRILQPSLGGNALTAIICTITPAAIEETNYTLGFATRAKKIKNKAQVNEVLSDAVMIKRMCKQISCLEQQLEGERQKCRSIETNLLQRQNQIIFFKEKPKVNRRRTWAPAAMTSENGASTSTDEKYDLTIRPIKSTESNVRNTLSIFGHQVEYTEEEFNSLVENSFSTILPMPDDLPLGKINNRSMSLLKTPKNYRNSMSKRFSYNPASPICSIDKDARIERLEKEIEEFQMFQNMETEQYQESLKERDNRIAQLQQEVDDYKSRVENEIELNRIKQSELDEQIRQFNEMESLYNATFTIRDNANKELKEMRKEVSEAIAAKKLAECNLTSNEFEFDQYKIKTKKREDELVEQLNNFQTNSAEAQLKERIKQLTETHKNIEMISWETESKLKLAIRNKDVEINQLKNDKEIINTKLRKCEQDYQRLNSEYDEMSVQIMDHVQGNDELKKQTQNMEEQIDELNKLNTKLSDEIKSIAESMRIDKESLQSMKDTNNLLEQKLKTENDKNSDEIDKLNAELIKCQYENSNLTKQNETLLENIESLTKHLQEMKVELSKVSNSLLDEQKRVEDLQKQNVVINKKIDSTKPDFEKLKYNELLVQYKKILTGFDALSVLSKYYMEKSDQAEDRYTELLRENTNLEDICNNSRITLQFTYNELIKLRKSHEDLKLYFASQELENMKLHKTICENSVNVTNLIDDTQIRNLEDKVDELTVKCNEYSNELLLITKCLEESDIDVGNETLTDENDKNLLKKVNQLKQTMVEYNRVLSILKDNDISIDQTDNIENAIIESQQRNKNIKEQLQQITNKYTKSKEQCNHLEEKIKTNRSDYVLLEIELNECQTKVVKLEQKIAQNNKTEIDSDSKTKFFEKDNQKIVELLTEIQTIKEDKLNLERNFKEKLDVLTAKCNEYSNELHSISDCLKEPENDSSNVNSTDGDASNLLKKVNQLKQTTNEYNRVLSILKNNDISIDQTENIENSIIESKQRYSKIREQLQQITDEYATSKELCNQINDELTISKTDYASLEMKFNANKRKIIELEQIIQQNIENKLCLESETKSFENANRKIEELLLEIQMTNEVKLQLEKNLEEKSQQNYDIETINSRLTEEIIELNEKIIALESSTVNVNDKYKLEMTEMNQRVENLRENNIHLESTISELKNDLKTERNEFEQQIELLSKENVDISLKLKEIEKKSFEMDIEISRLQLFEKQYQILSAENSEQIKRIEELTINLKTVKDQSKKLQSQMKQLDEQLYAKISELENLKQNAEKVEELKSENFSLNKRNEIINDEIEKLKIQLQTIKQFNIKKESDLEKTIEDLNDEIDRLKTRILVSEDKEVCLEKENQQILQENKQQVIQLEETKKELETKSIELHSKIVECEKFQIELQSTKNYLVVLEEKIKSFEQLETELKSLKESNSELEAEHKQLMIKMENQNHSIENMQKDLKQCSVMEMNRKNAEIRSLTEQLSRAEELYKNALKSQSNSNSNPAPKRLSGGRHSNGNADFDNLIKEHRDLKKSHERLVHEIDELRQSSRQTRKSKRLSLHDDTRRISGFDWNTNEIGIQTDPSTELCRCSEFVEKIAQLKRDIVIKDSKYNTLKANAGIERAKYDNDELKRELAKVQSALYKERMEHEQEIDKYKVKLAKRKNIMISTGTQTLVNVKDETSTANCQDNQITRGFVADMDFNKLSDKYQYTKKKILEFKDANDELTKKLEKMQASTNIIQTKYETLKKLCVYRQTEIDRLQKIEVELKGVIEKLNKNQLSLQSKYNGLKAICKSRGAQIEKLANTNSLVDENTSSAANR